MTAWNLFRRRSGKSPLIVSLRYQVKEGMWLQHLFHLKDVLMPAEIYQLTLERHAFNP